MRTRMTLTARGWCAAIVGVACIVGATQIALPDLAYIGVTLVTIVVCAGVSQLMGRRYDRLVRLVSSDLLAVGRESHVSIDVRARTLMSSSVGTWQDSLGDAINGSNRGIFPAIRSSLTSGDRNVVLRYPVSGVHRGVHPIGPLRVATTDPLGLTRRTTTVASATQVTVAPALVALAPLPSAAEEAGGGAHSSTTRLGEGADNMIARPYMPGDSMRRIHWRATAHRDEIMVRQEERESTPRAIVILDRSESRWSAVAGSVEASDNGFETALSLCISVAARLMYEGYVVHVVDQGGVELGEPLADDSDINSLLAAAATLTAHGVDSTQSLRSLVPDGGAGPLVLLNSRLGPHDVDAIANLSSSSTFAVLFGVDADPTSLADCRNAGWRAVDVPAASPAARDDAVMTSWLAALDQGAARVRS